jgi:hypothetical protein
MAISITFRPTSMNLDQYNEILKQLDGAGMGKPAGRLLHVCSGSGDRLTMFDVWESQDAFEALSQYLMPILDSLEIDPGIPAIAQVNNIVDTR